jgi:nucleoid DNA-binding protein
MLSKEVSCRLGVSQCHSDKMIVHASDTIVHRSGNREPFNLADSCSFEVRLRKGRPGRAP